MGVLDLFRRSSIPAPPPSRRLFDEEFQQKLEMLALVSRRVFAGRLRAERRSKKRGSGVEFADHRDYVPGDDIRSVDWNVYQRFQRLLVRLYEEEEDLSIYLLVDASLSMGFPDQEKLDQARRLCAALAYVSLSNLDRVTVVALSDLGLSRMPTTRGKGRIFKVFDFLESVTASGRTDLGEALKTFVAQHKRRGLAILISDLYDPKGFEAGINVLRFNRFEPCVLHLVDRRDAHPDLRGDLLVYDCETGEEREVTVDAGLLRRLEQAVEQYRLAAERFCTSRQVPYFAVDVQAPFQEVVLDLFRRGGFLR
jgi:uncharacterized protein (DUF58 family)